jgi:hypothetical protein
LGFVWYHFWILDDHAIAESNVGIKQWQAEAEAESEDDSQKIIKKHQ